MSLDDATIQEAARALGVSPEALQQAEALIERDPLLPELAEATPDRIVIGPYMALRLCPLCHGPNGKRDVILHLGMQRLANVLPGSPSELAETPSFPLTFMRCPSCGHAYLREVVDDELLFPSNYPFRSRVSGRFTAWCHETVRVLRPHLKMTRVAGVAGRQVRVLDVGANDGTMLRAFADVEDCEAYGLDPAEQAGAEASAACARVIAGRWPEDRAKLPHETWDVIIMQNVLGHVTDPRAMLATAAEALAEHGRLIVEVPSLGALLMGGLWDTIYHEHRHYWSLITLTALAEAVGLRLVWVRRHDIHGESYQVWFSRAADENGTDSRFFRGWAEPAGLYDAFQRDDNGRCSPLQREFGAGLHTALPFRAFGLEAFRTVDSLRSAFDALAAGGLVYGFGASAKAAVLLQTLRTQALSLVCDDTPTKQGRYMPSGHRICPASQLLEPLTSPAVILLSWNHAAALQARVQSVRPDARCAVALPELRWL